MAESIDAAAELRGCLTKMAIAPGAMGEAARYTLRVGDERLELNACLGRPLALAWTGAIACTHCGRATKKSFAQGHCYPC
ncbi:MAG: DUF2797 domain-containing protein, partial [Halomonas sp.]